MVDAERPRPLPPGHRRDRPGARPRRARPRTCASRWSTSALRARAYTREHGEDTRRSATGSGRALGLTGPRRQRRLEQPEAAAARPTGDDLVGSHATCAGRRRPGSTQALRGRSGRPDAVGHRVVHGGDALPRAGASSTTPCAALRGAHRPRAAAPAEVAGRARRRERRAARRAGRGLLRHGVPRDASRDAASTYALPARSGASAGGSGATASTACRTRGRAAGGRAASAAPAGLRLVTCHLGAGASLSAVRDGRSVDTTMGFTPLEGLVMATRSGSVDPGLLLWLLEHAGHAPARARATRSSTTSGAARRWPAPRDMREVVAAPRRGPGRALALEVYLHRLRARRSPR